MEATLKVLPSGLAAAAQRLVSAAAELAVPAVPTHPPLAPDQTSIAAAARLSEAAETLQRSAAIHAAALTDTAEHLRAIAVAFTGQEELNATTVQTLTAASEPVGSPGSLAPVPPRAADIRVSLPCPAAVDGEVVARQLWAGSASVGVDFTQSWRARSAAAGAARDVIRDVVALLPDLWNSPAGTPATANRLLQHDEAIADIAGRAAALAGQADSHALSYRDAVANMPKPAEFDAVRAKLRQALEANALFPGRFAPTVSSLIGQQGALSQQALNTQTQYHEETETETSQLPAMLGALGGALGSAVAAVLQMPQALMQSGQQMVQATVQGLSGLTTPAASGIDSATTRFDGNTHRGLGARAGSAPAATVPAGGTNMSPVSPATSSAPPPTTSVPQGPAHASTVAAAGPALTPTGMPMGMLAPQAGNDTCRQAAAAKKIVVPVVPHTESVTGRTAPERLTTAVENRSAHRRITVRTIEDEDL